MEGMIEAFKHFQDYLAPMLRLKPGERAVYLHLLRHTRMEGQRKGLFTAQELADGAGLTRVTARAYLLSLSRKGCVRRRRSQRKQEIEVLLPEEAVKRLGLKDFKDAWQTPCRGQNKVWYERIVKREVGRCFYCRRKLQAGDLEFDHIVPLSRGGWPSEDNVVVCCLRCNGWKGVGTAEHLLNLLQRQGILTGPQVRARKRRLKQLRVQGEKRREAA